ncbi:MAG: hypothetical protein AB4038_05680 [Prochloraceae cyanobacterium]
MFFSPDSTLDGIPQTSVQEILIEGKRNKINQEINQNIVFGMIYLPELDGNASLQNSIQGTFINGNNSVDQDINQTISNFSLLGDCYDNYYFPVENNFGIDEVSGGFVGTSDNNFFDNDLILDTIQFSSQETWIDGNKNVVNQESDQYMTNVFFVDDFIFSSQTDSLIDTVLDGIQFSFQDISIYGNKNRVNQELDQTITNFLVFDQSRFNAKLEDVLSSQTDNNFKSFLNLDFNFFDQNQFPYPSQFSIQETFIDGKKNLVTQQINQTISGFFVFDASLSGKSQGSVDKEGDRNFNSSLAKFDIDGFINTVLNDVKIEATQSNIQKSVINGKKNTEDQQTNQTLSEVPWDEYSSSRELEKSIDRGIYRNFNSKFPRFGIKKLINNVLDDLDDIEDNIYNRLKSKNLGESTLKPNSKLDGLFFDNLVSPRFNFDSFSEAAEISGELDFSLHDIYDIFS